MSTKAVTYRLPEELLNKIEKAVEVLKKENPYGTISKNSVVAGVLEKGTEEILKEESPVNLYAQKMKENFGFVEFEGNTYILTDQAEPTSRCLPAPAKNYSDAQMGEEYDFEMAAPATDLEGNKCTVYWIFTDIKDDNEKELDSFDYDDISRVEEI